jgi:hypothetical protein
LGDHVPPDYMTGLRDGAFYGWPYSYYGQHVDDRVKPQNPDMVARAVAPQYALGAHTASLGLCWSDGSKLPTPFHHGMFVGQHGSWNRKTRSGYEVVFVPFDHGQPKGLPVIVLRIPGFPWRLHGPTGRGSHRQTGRPAGRGRCRQHNLERERRRQPVTPFESCRARRAAANSILTR